MKIKFYKKAEKTPVEGQFCFFKYKSQSGKRIVLNTQPRQFFVDEKINFVEWAAVPPHALDDSSGWLFPSRGDDLPTDNISCLVCTDQRTRSPFYAYFVQDLYKFLGVPDGDVIAYQYI